MSREKFYLDKANAKLAGVCAGIADYTGIDAFWVRLITVVATLLGLSLTIPVYIAVALIAEKRPLGLYSEEEEARLLRREERSRTRRSSGSGSRARASRLHSEIDDIDRRVSDVEAYYRNSNPRLSAEIDALR